MKVLVVSRFLPHPTLRDSGGQDTYHTMVSLSERHDVSLISFAAPDQASALAALRPICHEVVVVPFYPQALTARLWRAGWRLLLTRVYGRNFSLVYRSQLRAMLQRQQYDIAIVDGMMAMYGRYLSGVKRIIDQVDVYGTVAYHAYRNESNLFQRFLLRLDWLRTTAAELAHAETYDGILVRSPKDKMLLQEYIPEQPIFVLSPWFEGLGDLQQILPERPPGNNLLFMGAMNLPANVEAVEYFVKHVFPLIRRQLPDASLTIVGANPSRQVKELQQVPGVVVTGEVETLTGYYEQCAVNVVPLLTGGGIIVKTLNGLAAARPTVATRLGISGIGARPGRDVLVVDGKPDRYAAAVIHLLQDSDAWARLAHAGRHFVQKHYNWSRLMRDLDVFLAGIAQV
jgi:polysaccharide biosynthesis protein PslH